MHNRILAGTLSICLGIAVFSIQDPLIKLVSGDYPVTEVMAIRSIVALPILLAVVQYDVGLGSLLSRRFVLLTLRATILFVSYTAYYLGVAALPLADAAAPYFMAPLFIMLMAAPYLGERVTARMMGTVMVGLVGVLIMLRPGSGMFNWAVLLSLGAAALYAFSQLMARKLGDTEAASVMTFYQNGLYLVGACAIAGLLHLAGIEHASHPSLQFLVRPWIWPTLPDFLMMAACGFVASAGMVLLSQAYRLAPANRIATFEYSGILWSPLWGYVFFSETPRLTTVIGAALVVGAGIVALNAGISLRKRVPIGAAARGEAARLRP